MTNNLPYWILQHLYVVLSLADVRTPEGIRDIYNVFELLHDRVSKFENDQEDIKARAKPLIAARKEYEWKGEINQETEETLVELDKKLRSMQETTEEFEWTPEQVSTIKKFVTETLQNLWNQNDHLNGYRRLEATAKIIQSFWI